MKFWNSKKVKLSVLVVLFIVISSKTFGQTKAVIYHQKIQIERSFEVWESKQKGVRVRAVKSAIKQSKEVNGTNNRKSRLRRKENNLRQNIIK